MNISYKKIDLIRNANPKKKIIFLAGTFDLFHVGHLVYLRKAKIFGDILVVGVNSDIRTKRVKGADRPIITQDHRAEIVGSINEVDYSFVMPARTINNLRPTFQVIQKLRPDIFMVTDKSWFEGLDFYKQNDTKVQLLPRIEITSTSQILNRIKSGVAD